MDILFIEKLIVTTKIGIYSWEKERLQKLIFNLKMNWNNKKAASRDNIKDCIDYTEISNSIFYLINNNKFSLIESVAEKTASFLIKKFQLDWIWIKVSKPYAIPMASNVGVIIERQSNKSSKSYL